MSDKKAPVPVRRFAVGDLLIESTGIFGDGCPAKVVRVSDDRKFIWISSDAVSKEVVKKYFNAFRCKLEIDCTGSVCVCSGCGCGWTRAHVLCVDARACVCVWTRARARLCSMKFRIGSPHTEMKFHEI